MGEAVARECSAVREAAAIFDASSMGKLVVSGPEAEAGLEWLSTNRIGQVPGILSGLSYEAEHNSAWINQNRDTDCIVLHQRVGRCVYTLMLNDAGGVECDVTVTRLDQQR